MSSSYIKLVFETVNKEECKNIADKIVQHLINKQIITGEVTDCVLGQEYGYPPAENCHKVIEDSENIFNISYNGLEIGIGRQVFYSDGPDEICCPNCNSNIIDLEWGDALSEWVEGSEKDKVFCSNCGQENSIPKFIFEPPWGFGELGLIFWNWGSNFKDFFLRDLETLTGHKVKVVYGKL